MTPGELRNAEAAPRSLPCAQPVGRWGQPPLGGRGAGGGHGHRRRGKDREAPQRSPLSAPARGAITDVARQCCARRCALQHPGTRAAQRSQRQRLVTLPSVTAAIKVQMVKPGHVCDPVQRIGVCLGSLLCAATCFVADQASHTAAEQNLVRISVLFLAWPVQGPCRSRRNKAGGGLPAPAVLSRLPCGIAALVHPRFSLEVTPICSAHLRVFCLKRGLGGCTALIIASVFLNLHATCPSKTCYRSSLALINNCKAGKRKRPSVRAESRRASLQASGALETKELLFCSCSMEIQVSAFP